MDSVYKPETNKDKKSVFKIMGASNHSDVDRQLQDYYASHPSTIDDLILRLKGLHCNVLEPAAGEGHLALSLESFGHNVIEADILKRSTRTIVHNFLEDDPSKLNLPEKFDIVTNPPYKYAIQFVKKSLEILPQDRYLAMLLKLTFLEGDGRLKLFKKDPPKNVHVYSRRIACAMNGDFSTMGSSSVAYCWFIWQKGFQGETSIGWIDNDRFSRTHPVFELVEQDRKKLNGR